MTYVFANQPFAPKYTYMYNVEIQFLYHLATFLIWYVILECMVSRPLVTIWYRLIFNRNSYCVNVHFRMTFIDSLTPQTVYKSIQKKNDDDIDDNKCEWENESKWLELDKITLIAFYWYECEVWSMKTITAGHHLNLLCDIDCC